MSICSRRYASKPTQILTQLRSPPEKAADLPPKARQPLLFLYPKWFRHASSHRYHIGHEPGPGHGSLGCCTRPSARLRDPGSPRGRHIRQYSSTSAISPAKPDNEKPRAPVKASREPKANSAVRDRDGRTVLTRNGLVTKYEVHGTLRKYGSHHRISFRKAAHEFDSKVAFFLQDIDAERHFMRLKTLIADEHDPEEKPNVSGFLITTKKARELSGTHGPNMWIHHDGSGCVVKVLPQQGHTKYKIELEGTERAREITRQYLKGPVACRISKEDQEWMSRVSGYSPYSDIRDLPYPPQWSMRNFIHYVNAITTPHAYRSAMRYVHQGAEHRHQVVGNLLERVFNDTSITTFASTKALQAALRFCRQYTELSHTAKHIWEAAHTFGLQPDVFCFNTELSRCLVIKDFDRYTNLLHTMRARNLRPDSTTFSLILRYAKDPGLRRRILDLIENHNLMQNQRANASITSAAVKQEVPHYLRGQYGLASLDERMTKRFGPGWLTTRNVERLLRACRMRRSNTVWASDVLAIVHKAQDSNVSLDLRCMTELFRIAKKAGALEDAIEILKSKPMQHIQDLSQELLDSFFLLAWQKKYSNLCRLIWLHAATLGRITKRMQNIVQHSLQSNITSKANPNDRAWLLLAGKIIINAGVDAEQAKFLFPLLAQHDIKSSSTEWLLHWSEDGAIRHEQMQLSQLLLEQDLHAWRFYEPIRHQDFLLLIDKAITLDEEWKISDAAVTVSPSDLLTRSLKIPRRRRAEPLVVPTTGTHGTERRRHFTVNERSLSYDTFAPLDTKDNGNQLDKEPGQTHEPVRPVSVPIQKAYAGDLQLKQLATVAEGCEPSNAWKDDESQMDFARIGPDGEPARHVQYPAYA